MINALLIGCGKFSGFADPENTSYYYGALKKADINLKAIYDSNFKKSKFLSKKFKIFTSNSLDELIQKCKPDIVIISTPINTHYKIINMVSKSNHRFKLIVEKPIVDKIQKLKQVMKLFKKKKINFTINHTRRFDENFEKVKKLLIGKSEMPKNINVNFYGDWLNTGIHIIDTIFFFLGDIKLKKFSIKKYENLFILKLFFYNNKIITVHLKKFNDVNYQVFDFDFFYKKHRFQIRNFSENFDLYSSKKNFIGETELCKLTFKKLNQYPLVNMLKKCKLRKMKKNKISFLEESKILNVYNLFFKLNNYIY